MLLLRQLKLPLLPLRGCAGELGLSQPGSPGVRGAGHSKQVNLRRAVLDRRVMAVIQWDARKAIICGPREETAPTFKTVLKDLGCGDEGEPLRMDGQHRRL
ncbi:unnamed protein product [Pleuronectes platessa]|uniref:Uncharacterized protein n=1 Tax=Pleuronectes platessa TaxID=8262 RepID=A0A9N7UL02_PLEPL|nr:unnamed protein product [Pleuronectes platessa]